jgi:hypothetical protein
VNVPRIRKRKAPAFTSLPNGKVQCPVCSKEFSVAGSGTHWRVVHKGDRRYGEGGPGWNRGLLKTDSNAIGRQAAALSRTMKKFAAGLTVEERKKRFGGPKKFSPLNGGIRRGAGRGKKGWYRGFWCDSSWELAWVMYQLDHGVGFTRNTVGFEYSFLGETHKFYPDFRLVDGTYVEVKGWLDARNKAKVQQFPHEMQVVGKQEIATILNYAKSTYGEDFTRLYQAR